MNEDMSLVYIYAIAFGCGCAFMYKMLEPQLQQLKQLKKQKQVTEQEIPIPNLEREQISFPKEPLDFIWLSTIITRMNQKKKRLNTIDEFLTSTQLGMMGNTQRIRLSCGGADREEKEGGRSDYTFQIDDADQQQHLVVVAEKERAKIRTSLEEDVDLICAMRRYGVTQSVTLTEQFSEIPRGEG